MIINVLPPFYGSQCTDFVCLTNLCIIIIIIIIIIKCFNSNIGLQLCTYVYNLKSQYKTEILHVYSHVVFVVCRKFKKKWNETNIKIVPPVAPVIVSSASQTEVFTVYGFII